MTETHVFPVRVYYEDTDAGGVVYYANYLRFAERARTEMLRAQGIGSSRLMAEKGIAIAVRHCRADFLKPAVLDDLLEVHTRITEVRGASLRGLQAIRRAGEDLARLDIKLACISLSGGPARLPDDLRSVLNKLSGQE